MSLPGNLVVSLTEQSGSFTTPEFGSDETSYVALELKGTGTVTFDAYIEGSNSRENWVEITGTEKAGIDNDSAHIWELQTSLEFLRIGFRNVTGTFDTVKVYLGNKV